MTDNLPKINLKLTFLAILPHLGKCIMSAFIISMTTPMTSPEKRPTRIVIPTGTVRLPVAPPSPFFDGMNTNINTEPFPDIGSDFKLDAAEKAEPLHCVLHCQESVCKRMTLAGFDLPPCRCTFEDAQPVKVPASRPKGHVDDPVMDALSVMGTHVVPSEELEIQQADITGCCL
ncbi:uncharacterized protein K460DRAFT_406433 [Cucurbitaria berberidis CBS 394.84]|uniref:Uncharacterized protein n=1 Tax=Cucurbitaria berberidis CBS 394.84 TaxID=1168544 RepID=A0A9P4GHG0_9PLEO|nr:uncharacterized protein K460DRAFT_406433 [Cucurbitaria berberidis CBS 394.84]KAF1846213.1 hypothetical protein K460DRAFT_406433 [Cucurbitaria berberidis CBS 394.84]